MHTTNRLALNLFQVPISNWGNITFYTKCIKFSRHTFMPRAAAAAALAAHTPQDLREMCRCWAHIIKTRLRFYYSGQNVDIFSFTVLVVFCMWNWEKALGILSRLHLFLYLFSSLSFAYEGFSFSMIFERRSGIKLTGFREIIL